MNLRRDVEAAILATPGAVISGGLTELPDGISEAAFVREIIKRAKKLGHKAAHFRSVRVQRKDGSTHWQTPVQGDGAGFVDLIIAAGDTLYAIEAKVGRNKPTLLQLDWLEAFRGVRRVVPGIWRPEDWQAINEILRRES